MCFFSDGAVINLQRSYVVDYPIGILREGITLFAARPTGTAPNMWVYVRVFGVVQWTIILTLLGGFVIALTLTAVSREEAGANSMTLHASQAVDCAYLFAIQQGEHTADRHFGARILSMTGAIFTMLVMVYYENDITAEMTAGPPPIPIKTFEDVLHYDYKVIAWSTPLSMLLASPNAGKFKNEVYQRYFADGQLKKSADAQSRNLMIRNTIKEVMSNPKTLFYSHKAVMIQADQLLQGRVLALQMDDASHINLGFALQKDSEFLEIMNHYILKEAEHGILMHEIRSHYDPIYRYDQFGMNEPEPLAYNNFMFVFICLGMGIMTSLTLALYEKISAIGIAKKLPQTLYESSRGSIST